MNEGFPHDVEGWPHFWCYVEGQLRSVASHWRILEDFRARKLVLGGIHSKQVALNIVARIISTVVFKLDSHTFPWLIYRPRYLMRIALCQFWITHAGQDSFQATLAVGRYLEQHVEMLGPCPFARCTNCESAMSNVRWCTIIFLWSLFPVGRHW